MTQSSAAIIAQIFDLWFIVEDVWKLMRSQGPNYFALTGDCDHV